MAWSGTNYFTVSIDTSRKTIFDGDFQISGDVVNLYYRDPTEAEIEAAAPDNITSVTVTETRPWTTSIHVVAVANVTVTIEESRGNPRPSSLPAGSLAGDITISWSRSDSDGGLGVHASGSMILKECDGDTVTYSARRVNEADGWTITKTTTSISTTVSAPGCTIS